MDNNTCYCRLHVVQHQKTVNSASVLLLDKHGGKGQMK